MNLSVRNLATILCLSIRQAMVIRAVAEEAKFNLTAPEGCISTIIFLVNLDITNNLSKLDLLDGWPGKAVEGREYLESASDVSRKKAIMKFNCLKPKKDTKEYLKKASDHVKRALRRVGIEENNVIIVHVDQSGAMLPP